MTSDTAAPLAPGSAAPNFELPSTPDQKVSLEDFRGQPVILAFYPEDWSPVCCDQLALYQELLPEFQRYNAELLGISVDGIWSHLAFAKDRNLHFPLLADFEPKGEVARAYRRVPDAGRHQRAGALRDRPRRRRRVELRVPGGHQPRSGRDPSSSREPDGGGRHVTRTEWEPTLTMPVSADRDHIQGPADCAGHARRVRRLPVPVLRSRIPDDQGRPGSDG